MINKRQQNGFALLELLLILVVIALLIGAGVYVYKKRSSKTSSSTPSPSATTQMQPAITQKSDLQAATNDLKKVDNSTSQDEDSLRQSTN